MGDLSITTPAHLNWILKDVTEIRYTGWEDDEPCPLPKQPGSTLDHDRVSQFVCSRIAAMCPAVESRRPQLQAILSSDCAKNLIADSFWLLHLELFALTDGVARLAALRHIVGNLLDELHCETEENQMNECLTDPRSVQLIENALRSGVQSGSALTQGFLSACGYVTLDVTGVKTTTSAASSAQQTTMANVAKVPLPHHLAPKILEDIDSFSQKKRQSGGSKMGLNHHHQHPSSSARRPVSSASSVAVSRASSKFKSNRSSATSSRAASTSSSAASASSAAESSDNAATMSSAETVAQERKAFLRSRSRSVQDDSPEVLLHMLQYSKNDNDNNKNNEKSTDDSSQRNNNLHASRNGASSRASSGASSVRSRTSSGGESNRSCSAASSNDDMESCALSATALMTRKSKRKKVRLNSRASSLFLGECTQPDVTPKTILQLVISLGTAFTPASIIKSASETMNKSSSSNSIGNNPLNAMEQAPSSSSTLPRAASSGADAAASESVWSLHEHYQHSFQGSSTCVLATSDPFLDTSSSGPNASGGNNYSNYYNNNNNNSNNSGKSGSNFGMTRAVLEEIVRAKLQDYQSKPYSGRTEATAAIRTLRDAHLLTKLQARKLLMDKSVASTDQESITKKRGIVLAAVEAVAAEQNRIFSRLARNFAALMKRMTPRGHTSSVSVPRDMVLPFLSDALAQVFCALVFDTAPYLRSELKVETRRAAKRHLSFWLDGVDSDNISNWTNNWARPRLLHRNGAEKATVNGVTVGQNEAQQQLQLGVVRAASSASGSSPASFLLKHVSQLQKFGSLSPLSVSIGAPSASARRNNNNNNNARGSPSFASSAFHDPSRLRSSALGKKNKKSKNKKKFGDATSLSPASAALVPTNVALQKHMEMNQQLSLFTGGITVLPQPRNARAELNKMFGKLDDRQREDEALRWQMKGGSAGRIPEPSNLGLRQLQQRKLSGTLSCLVTPQASSLPAPQHSQQHRRLSFAEEQPQQQQQQQQQRSGTTVSGQLSFSPTRPRTTVSRNESTVVGGNGGGERNNSNNNTADMNIILPPAMIARETSSNVFADHLPSSPALAVAAAPSSSRAASTRDTNIGSGAGGLVPRPPPLGQRKTRPIAVSTRLYNPDCPGSCLTSLAVVNHLDLTNEQRLKLREEEERRLEEEQDLRRQRTAAVLNMKLKKSGGSSSPKDDSSIHCPFSKSFGENKRSASPATGKLQQQQQQEQAERERRVSVHVVNQQEHNRRIEEIRSRLDEIQAVLSMQQTLQQQWDAKEKHRKKFMNAAAVQREQEEKVKERKKQLDAEQKKLGKITGPNNNNSSNNNNASSSDGADVPVAKEAISYEARLQKYQQQEREEQEKRQRANRSPLGMSLYHRGGGGGRRLSPEEEAKLQKQELEQRKQRAATARANRNHYRQPTTKLRDEMMRIHLYQDEMEKQHPGEFKFQPRTKLLSSEELAVMMKEQQDLMRQLSQESAGVAEAYQKQMIEELMSPKDDSLAGSGRFGSTGGLSSFSGDPAPQKKFGAGNAALGVKVGAKDIVRSLDASASRAVDKRNEVTHAEVGTRTYTANRSATLSAREQLTHANKLCRTHRFAPANQPDPPWHRFGAQHRPPPSATTQLTQGNEFFAEGTFALGELSPVVERYCLEQGISGGREVAKKYPSSILFSILVPASKNKETRAK